MGLLLLSPQIPMLFMGEEVGSETPFLFFTDFHDELADAVREGRRKEFAKFAAFADPQAREAIPDPNALSTFEASRPRPGPDAGLGAISSLICCGCDANIWRRTWTPALSLGAQAIGPKAVQARWRVGAKTFVLAVNLGDQARAAFTRAGGTAARRGRRGAGRRRASGRQLRCLAGGSAA
jgi:maltooligosyltrehalose trehalohydrolase